MWVVVSGVNVQGSDKIVGFIYRLLLYGSAPVFGLYVFNARSASCPTRPWSRPWWPSGWWWSAAGSSAWPATPPGHHAGGQGDSQTLPGELVRLQPGPPKTAQIQSFLGFPVPDRRPVRVHQRLGGNYACWSRSCWRLDGEPPHRPQHHRAAAGPLSLIPVIFSLNRTLWASLASSPSTAVSASGPVARS